MQVVASAISSERAALLTDFIRHEAAGTDALIALENGEIIFEYGPTDVPSNLHSGRKSIISLLFGIAQEKGLLDVNSTLGELGIDETQTPLTDVEKTATIAHLLQARSGVYLASGAETQNMKDGRPTRGQYLPGENHYYNNWDFNVLGTIFEQETSLSLGVAIDNWLAQPLGLQDFHSSHVIYDSDTSSTQHRTYRIHMSARDLARIGFLVQQGGAWNGEQVVPTDWISLTTQPFSKLSTRAYDGYGYLWWLNSERDIIAADGWGGQYLHIDRGGPFVLVNRQDTGNSKLGYLMFVYPSHSNDPLDVYKIHDILTGQVR
ncbi:serine hydrolase domain-containing protein [Halocynthiibacter styelae]|uniref:Serine hydrolase n=1 Tax=Halocynthiibacter styelae TaxID=2761955 RepID=A0A8J7LLL4_9RHOB|nr:serine hydrolase [Paenihalocynthiibacter styelae]MBI1495560.1 serine hydrolase [Paenihalocynthiibacter styelae]